MMQFSTTFRRDTILPSSRAEGGKLYVIMEKRVQFSTSFPIHPSTTWTEISLVSSDGVDATVTKKILITNMIHILTIIGY